jgi:hypothetical protein
MLCNLFGYNIMHAWFRLLFDSIFLMLLLVTYVYDQMGPGYGVRMASSSCTAFLREGKGCSWWAVQQSHIWYKSHRRRNHW